MIRKITTTRDKIPSILRSLTLVKIAVDVSLIEYQQYLDVNFKSPVIHSKLNQVSSNLEYASRKIESDFLKVPDREVAESNTFKHHEVMQRIIKLDEDGLDWLLETLDKAIISA